MNSNRMRWFKVWGEVRVIGLRWVSIGIAFVQYMHYLISYLPSDKEKLILSCEIFLSFSDPYFKLQVRNLSQRSKWKSHLRWKLSGVSIPGSVRGLTFLVQTLEAQLHTRGDLRHYCSFYDKMSIHLACSLSSSEKQLIPLVISKRSKINRSFLFVSNF